MKEIGSYLSESAAAYGISLTTDQEKKFQSYLQLLVEWNEKMNLTAITESKAVAIKHFLDSLLLLKAVELPKGAKIIDVGTGAGFPGVPVKIMRPDIQLTLLDSLNKRLIFLKELSEALSIKVELLHIRAEEGGRQRALRQQFYLATARAVAPMNLLCEYCLPFVKTGGFFAAMKGPGLEEELQSAEKAVGLLGGRLQQVAPFTLPDGSIRNIAVIQKIRDTPAIYPRHGSKIAKSPL